MHTRHLEGSYGQDSQGRLRESDLAAISTAIIVDAEVEDDWFKGAGWSVPAGAGPEIAKDREET
jgi:hypothetical protein